MKYYKLDGLKIKNLFSYSSGGLKSKKGTSVCEGVGGGGHVSSYKATNPVWLGLHLYDLI